MRHMTTSQRYNRMVELLREDISNKGQGRVGLDTLRAVHKHAVALSWELRKPAEKIVAGALEAAKGLEKVA